MEGRLLNKGRWYGCAGPGIRFSGVNFCPGIRFFGEILPGLGLALAADPYLPLFGSRPSGYSSEYVIQSQVNLFDINGIEIIHAPRERG